LERLGDFHFAEMKDPAAAADAWKASARLSEGFPAEAAQAQALYERVLEARPDDREAASHLATIYVQANDWTKLPAVLRALVRTDGGIDPRRLLDLEKPAADAGAVEEYVGLVDDLLARSPDLAGEVVRALKRARARALSSDASRWEQAAAAHREIV